MQLFTIFLISEKIVQRPIATEHICPKNAKPLIRLFFSFVHGNVGKILSTSILPSATLCLFPFSSSFAMFLTIVDKIELVSSVNTRI